MTIRFKAHLDHARCPACGSESLVDVHEAANAETRDGTQISYPDVFTRCEKCGHEFYTRDQSLAHSRAIAGAARETEGMYTPEGIRRVREGVGLSQAQFERALGVGAKTVVRWERGTVAQSRAADNLIWLAENFPTVFARLAQRHGVALPAKEAHALSGAEESWADDSNAFLTAEHLILADIPTSKDRFADSSVVVEASLV